MPLEEILVSVDVSPLSYLFRRHRISSQVAAVLLAGALVATGAAVEVEAEPESLEMVKHCQERQWTKFVPLIMGYLHSVTCALP